MEDIPTLPESSSQYQKEEILSYSQRTLKIGIILGILILAITIFVPLSTIEKLSQPFPCFLL